MSYLIYEGPSMLTGAQIFVALSGIDQPSKNTKTGPLPQTWIMPSDVSPLEATKTGQDEAVCGNCSLRGDGTGKGRVCYVTLFRGPDKLYKAYAEGRMKKANNLRLLLKNRSLRLGAWGEQTAAPVSLTHALAKAVDRRMVGYTHQWRTCDPDFKNWVMASVSSPEEREQAKAMGWPTFRVKSPQEPRLERELLCPASQEAGHKLTCFQCMRCYGKGAPDTVVDVHGPGQRNFVRQP